MRAAYIQRGDVCGDSYVVLSVRNMKIDGKPAVGVLVRYKDKTSGMRYWHSDDDAPLARPAKKK